MIWIGLISGTSADAVDAALVRIEAPSRLELLAYLEQPLPDALRARIHALSGSPTGLRELLALDRELGARFADAAIAVAAEAGVRPAEIAGIGSHGQTVAHHPEPEVRGSLQLGSAALLHERTGIPVVADFRSADLAAGGQGAPLTPFLHHAVFADAAEPRAVLNIGGFTNVSYLPDRDAGHVVAFDPGPGNALLDRAARLASDGRERCDFDGARARRGRVLPEVVAELLADPYFAKAPPKSTGHEYFGEAFFSRARDAVRAAGGSPDDLVASLVELSAASVAAAAESFFPEPAARWLVYGGGVRNPVLIGSLAEKLAPAPVEPTDVLGVPAEALEAMTFALLGYCAARGLPSNLPAATGAQRAVVLGSVTPPDAFRS